MFQHALAPAPADLPTYFCLYKIHTYRGDLDKALAFAEARLQEAARQLGWAADYRAWPWREDLLSGPARFALYTLKALAFIRLRRNEPDKAGSLLALQARLDPAGAVGWPVVADLAKGTDHIP